MLDLSVMETRELTPDEAYMLFQLLNLAHNGNIDKVCADMEKELTMFKILKGRIAAFELKIKPELCALLSAFYSNPGQAISVMFCCNSRQVYDISGFAQLFPMGIPTDDSLSKFWDSQKYDKGNKLDNVDYWHGEENSNSI